MSKSVSTKTTQKRATNYSLDECWRLVNLVVKYKHLVENKKTDAVTWQEKNLAWQEIAQKFNCGVTHPRTGEQLRHKFDSLKKDVRKDAAKYRQQLMATGGGPYVEKKVNPLFDKIREIILLSSEGLPSIFDSDGLDIASNASLGPAQTIGDDQVVSFKNDSTIVFELVENDVQGVPDHELRTLPWADIHNMPSTSSTPPEAVTGSNWQTYSPAMLKKPKHSALTLAINNSVAEDVSLDDDSQSGDAINNAEFRTKPSEKSTSCRTPHWVNRRRPASTTTSAVLPMSANGKRLGSWADARRELAVLQRELLQKEFDNREKREADIHLQVSKINELKLKKLEMEIKITEATLKKLN